MTSRTLGMTLIFRYSLSILLARVRAGDLMREILRTALAVESELDLLVDYLMMSSRK